MRSLILCVASVLTLAWPAEGQQAPKPTPVDRQEPEKQDAEKKKPEWGFVWDDRPSFRLGRGTRVDLRFRWQGDIKGSEAPLPGNDDESTLDIARRRAGIDGEILNVFDYQLEYELGDERDPWRDVFLNYKQFHVVQLQGGQFKMPFSMDENTSPTKLDFIYRSRAASLLAPGREQGVMVHGRVLDREVLRYELGAFRHDGRNARTNNTDRVYGDLTVAGRITLQPFRSTTSTLSDLAVGVAFTRSELREGFSDLRGRTALDSAFYRPYFWVNGTRRRAAIEARWRPGPFSIKAEYIRLSDERLDESVEDTALSPFLATGWYVSGTWAVTGENKASGLDNPHRPLFKGGYGAVELAARIERVHFGSKATGDLPSISPRADVLVPNSDRVATFGVNWYLNRWAKIQVNLIRDAIANPALGPLPSQPTFWSRLVRFQFSM